ncbi:hypothetical protein RB625_12865 [Streptomyces californicus]|uniref:hypothetical protein n=1 Tax=Streptomyces californicus TaxID=67351 RepID=UPI00296E82B4|nr:hypothetical protein [Streptomyces californicus]MDW4899301.1 hypothetical protein [Streptomyces californicus]
MRRHAVIMTSLALSIALTTLATGCSREKEKTSPEIPNQFCWSALEKKTVQPLMPAGNKISQDIKSFYFTDRISRTRCKLYVDGRYAFGAHAKFPRFEEDVDWSSWEKYKPDPVRAGKKAIVWDTGAASYLPCKPLPGAGPSTATRMELEIFVAGSGNRNDRKALSHLIKQFSAFAEKHLTCA